MKLNKTVEYNRLRKIAGRAGMNQYEAAEAAMEMVLNYKAVKKAKSVLKLAKVLS